MHSTENSQLFKNTRLFSKPATFLKPATRDLKPATIRETHILKPKRTASGGTALLARKASWVPQVLRPTSFYRRDSVMGLGPRGSGLGSRASGLRPRASGLGGEVVVGEGGFLSTGGKFASILLFKGLLPVLRSCLLFSMT